MKNFFTVFVLLSLIGLSSVFAQIPTDSLKAWYPFNGNANDESGNGNNGTVNGATLTIDRFGNPNKAYNFNGVNNYIEIADNQVFHSLNQITLSVWFKANAFTNAWVKLIGKHYDASSGSFYLIWEHNYVRFSAITSFQYGGIVSGNLVDGNWHNAIGVYDGSLMSLYIDGLLVNSSANAGTINETNDALTIGRSESWDEYYNGLIDDICIYSRVLDGTEIDSLYHENGWVGINEATKKINDIAIYPNPVSDYLTIENSHLTKGETISIYNIQGQLLLQQPLNQAKLKMDNLIFTKGVYILIIGSKESISVKRIVKE